MGGRSGNCFNPFQGLTRFEALGACGEGKANAHSGNCFNPFQGLTRFEAHLIQPILLV
jgi:hypothetical protein